MCQQETKDWIEDIVEKTVNNYNGREVVIWGKYEVGDTIKEELEKRHEIGVAFFIDSDISKIDNNQVFSSDILCGKSDTYYVVIPLAFYQGIKEKLKRGTSSIRIIIIFATVSCSRKQIILRMHTGIK